MNEVLKNQVAVEIAKLARAIKELQQLSEEGTLTAGNVVSPLIKIENLSKRIRHNLPQF
jgi:hypothetical protein